MPKFKVEEVKCPYFLKLDEWPINYKRMRLDVKIYIFLPIFFQKVIGRDPTRKLVYNDGQLTMEMKGEICQKSAAGSPDTNFTVKIEFLCDHRGGKGRPIFVMKDHCGKCML